MELNDQQFIAAVRSALHYLYEPDQLHRNPLIGFFGLQGRLDATLTLQQRVLDAIQSLKPGDDDPAMSNAWRLYDLLYFRYVRGYERIEVANQLGISERQLAREQKNAIEALALVLLKFCLPGAVGPEAGPAGLTSDPTEAAGHAWSAALPAETLAAWKPVLLSVTELVGPLAYEHRVQVSCEPVEHLPDLLIPQATLRHSLLIILSWMMPLAQEASILLSPQVQEKALVFKIAIPERALAAETSYPEVEAARQLVEPVGGILDVVAGADSTQVWLTVPAQARIPVLVVDDNADTLQLFQRYAQGSRYTVVGVQDPAEALRVIEKTSPRILLLDVMMPELDGWDLLTQLRTSSQGQNLSVIMCSILPQEGLARSLGADGFLQKPVLPQDFLTALDRQTERFPQEPDRS